MADLRASLAPGARLLGLDLGSRMVGLALTDAATDWAKDLSAALALPAALWDERLSSAAVNRAMIQEADLTRKKRAAAVDSAAAAWMLQGALDATAARGYNPAP